MISENNTLQFTHKEHTKSIRSTLSGSKLFRFLKIEYTWLVGLKSYQMVNMSLLLWLGHNLWQNECTWLTCTPFIHTYMKNMQEGIWVRMRQLIAMRNNLGTRVQWSLRVVATLGHSQPAAVQRCPAYTVQFL